MDSYRKSSTFFDKPQPKAENKALKAMERQAQAMERLSNALEKNLTLKESDFLKAIQNKDSSLAQMLKENLETLAKLAAEIKPVQPAAKPPAKWRFNIQRDTQGRIQSVEAEPE
jgi:hypothetical protein